MEFKQKLLDGLSRSEPATLVDQHGLDVDDRRSKHALVGALARSRKLPLDELLAGLSRQQLKSMCASLGLDDSGREKSVLIERIRKAANGAVGLETKSAHPLAGTNGSSTAPGKRKTNGVEPNGLERLPERVVTWAGRLGVDHTGGVLVRSQQRRWASCDAAGALRFNWRIIQAPVRLVDYVVAHELVHLVHRDHTQDFWRCLGRAMADYELGPRLEW